MRLKFTKMHGLGNDFVVFDATVTTRGGDLSILWEGEGRPVEMTGPAVTVFEGEIEI